MEGEAAWGFVRRAFESMLIEASENNLTSLHSALLIYFDGNRRKSSSFPPPVAEARNSENGSDKKQVEFNKFDASVEETKRAAENTFEEVEAGLVLSTLRLAFETKNITVVELALDCFHKLIAYDLLEGDLGLEGGKNAAFFADFLSMICNCVDNSSDSTVLRVLKVLTIAVTSEKFRVHGEPLLGVVRVCFDVAINSNNPINQAGSKSLLSQIVSTVFQGMESGLGMEASMDKASHLPNGGSDLESISIKHRDALLLFRTLCTIGKKGENYEILSLELLQGLLEGVSDAFTKSMIFIDSLKAHLSNTLLKASVSLSPAVNQLAAGIFTVLLLRFRVSLKVKIGNFFPLVVLRYLNNPQSPANLRLSLLRMLEKVCKDPQILTDIFVNFDCDLDAPNHFEQLATSLSKIAQGTLASDLSIVGIPQISAPVKVSSLQCLVNILQSLIDWVKSRKESDQKITDQNSLNASAVDAAVKQTMISDFLGQHQELSLSAMHAYVDSMKFSGMTFAAAIREFLSGFRLPGEAQKIDSIVEKFAERYCADNPAIFKNADTAYVLAYAVIMLNSNAHNPMVSANMTKADFVRLNSKAEAEETPPRELLDEIYDSIVKEEIKIKIDLSVFETAAKQNPKTEEKGSLLSILNLALSRSKSPSEIKSEIDAIVKQTQVVLRNEGTNKEMFYTSRRIEVVKPMIEALGWPLLDALSVIMEEGDYKPRIQLCMEGFKAAIYITHALEMDTLRNALVTSLTKSTFLHAPKEMRTKNVEALRTLLSLLESDVSVFEDTWSAVLNCISQIEFITSNPDAATTETQALNQISRDAYFQSLRQLAEKHSEKVFLNSVKLPSDVAVKFFTALCDVSAEDLKQNPPRVYSLYKLVEISFQNMARIRMVWARIWAVVADHFIFAGSHSDEMMAMYAIDSLWRLVMKYLERAEFANFTFQNDILKPLVVLMRNNQSESRRKFIIDLTVQMIKSKVGCIKSGWRSVFIICTDAAADGSERIVKRAFEFVESVMWEHFDQVVGTCFMDCVKCLAGFAKSNSSHHINLKAIALLRTCEDRLAQGVVPGGAVKPIGSSPGENFDATEQFWVLMLSSLSDLTSDPRVEVRRCAVEVLFDLLNKRGTKFSRSFWETIFHRALFTIFNHIRSDGEEITVVPSDVPWLLEIRVHSMKLLWNLFNTYYTELSFMIPPLLSFLVNCVMKTEESVAPTVLGALVQLIEAGGDMFSDNEWDTLLKSIRDASKTAQPLELLNKPTDSEDFHRNESLRQTQTQETVKLRNIKEEAESQLPTIARSRCTTQTLLLAVIDSIQKKYWFKLKTQQKMTIIEILQSVLDFAAAYNSCSNLQLRMRQISADRPPLNLLQQELAGTCLYLNILQKLTSEVESSEENNSEPSDVPDSNTAPTNNHQSNVVHLNEDKELACVAEEKLVSFCGRVLNEASEFLSAVADTDNMEIHRVLELRSPIIVKVIEGIAAMNCRIFKKHLRDFRPSLTKLASCNQMNVRGALNEVFKTQLSVLLP